MAGIRASHFNRRWRNVGGDDARVGEVDGKRDDPGGWFVNSYPTFRTKRLLRFLFDRFQSDALFNLLLHTKMVRMAASIVYFHHKGIFDPAMSLDQSRDRADAEDVTRADAGR